MKHTNAILILLFLIIGTSMAYADEIENLFDNPGFEEGKGRDLQAIPGWNLYKQSDAAGFISIDDEEQIEGDQCVMIEVTDVPAGGEWNLRFDHDRRFAVEEDETYTMSFWLKGDPGPITFSPSRAEQNAAGEWGNMASKQVNPTVDWEEYYLTFTSTEDRLIMWQLLISNPGHEYYIDHARCYVGEYVEDEFDTKPVRAVSPSGKLTAQWGKLKLK